MASSRPNPDLGGMTENLWYHALKFLDKYRTDAQTYDVEELYKFADETGILERHKQLLAQPYHDNQIDMKIMYYELIKMLISYERQHHPEQYDATKSVGKIEGYQELTNKLQRYLNQRFIEDIEKLGNDILELNQINIHNKMEVFQENFIKLEQRLSTIETQNLNLEAKNVELEVKVENLEAGKVVMEAKVESLEVGRGELEAKVASLEVSTGRLTSELEESRAQLGDLRDQINLLKEKNSDLNILIESHEKTQSEHHIEQQSINQAVRDLLQTEKQERILLDERVNFLTETDKIQNDRFDGLDGDVDALKIKLEAINNDFSTLIKEEQAQELTTLKGRIDLISTDLNTEKLNIQDNLAAIQERLTGHDSNLVGVQDSLADIRTFNQTLEHNLAQIKTDINTNSINITTNTTNITNNTTSITTINENVTNIFQTLNNMNTRAAETEAWNKDQFDRIEESLQLHRDSMLVTIKEMTEENDKIRGMENFLRSLNDGYEETKRNQSNMKDNITKLEEDLSNLNKTTQQVETRIKEVTVLATNIDVHVKAQEEKIEKQAEGDIKEMRDRIGVLESSANLLGDHTARLQYLNTSLEEHKSRLHNLEEASANNLQFRAQFIEPMHQNIAVVQQTLVQNAADQADASNNLMQQLRLELEEKVRKNEDDLSKAEVNFNSILNGLKADIEVRLTKSSEDINNSKETINLMMNEFTTNFENKIMVTKEETEKRSAVNEKAIQSLKTEIQENTNGNASDIMKMKDSLNTMLGQLRVDLQEKITENKEELLNASDEFGRLDDELNKIRENMGSISTSIEDTLNIHITNNNNDVDKKIDEIKSKINEIRERIDEQQGDISNIRDVTNSSGDQINVLIQQFKTEVENKLKENTDEVGKAGDNFNILIQQLKDEFQEKHNENKEELLNASEEFGRLDDELNKIRENMGSITTSIEDTLNIHITSNNEDIDKKMGEMKIRIDEHQAEIVNIKDASTVHNETARYVERLSSRVDSIDDERKKSELDMIQKNEELINMNSKDIQELKNELNLQINEIRNSVTEDMIKRLEDVLNSLEELRKKEKDDYDIILQLNEVQKEKNTLDLDNISKELNESMQQMLSKIEVSIDMTRKGTEEDFQQKLNDLQEKLNEVQTNGHSDYDSLVRSLEDKIEGLKNAVDVSINLSQKTASEETLAKLQQLEHDLRDLQAKGHQTLEVAIIDLTKKMDENKDNIETNLDILQKNAQNEFENKINDLDRALRELQAKDHSNIEIVINDLKTELNTTKENVERLGNKEKEDHEIVIQLNEEVKGQAKGDHDKLSITIDDLKNAVDELKNKEKQDFEVAIQMTEEKEAKIMKDIESLLGSLEIRLNTSSNATIAAINESISGNSSGIAGLNENITNIYQTLNNMNTRAAEAEVNNEELDKKIEEFRGRFDELKDNLKAEINLSGGNIDVKLQQLENDLENVRKNQEESMDSKVKELRENFELNINVSQKDMEENLSSKMQELEKLLIEVQNKEKENYEVVLKLSNEKEKEFKAEIERVSNSFDDIKLTIEELRNQEKEDIQVIINQNLEASDKYNNKTAELTKNLEGLQILLQELSQKEKDNYGVILQMINERDESGKAENDKLVGTIEEKVNVLKDSINVSINLSEKKIEDDITLKLSEIEKALDELRATEKEDINSAVANLDEKINGIMENFLVTMNIIQKNVEEGFGTKLDNFEKEFADFKEKEKEVQENIINDLENKMKAVKENIEVNVNMVQTSSDERTNKKLEDMKKLLSELDTKGKDNVEYIIGLNMENENKIKKANDDTKSSLMEELKELQSKVEVNITNIQKNIEENSLQKILDLQSLMDDLTNKEKEDFEVILKMNDENAKKSKLDLDNVLENINGLQLVIEEIRNKGKQDYDLILQMNEVGNQESKESIQKMMTDLEGLHLIVEGLTKKEKEDYELFIKLSDDRDANMRSMSENTLKDVDNKIAALKENLESLDIRLNGLLEKEKDDIQKMQDNFDVSINIVKDNFAKNLNDSGIEMSNLVERLSELEKSGDDFNNSLTSISLEIDDKLKGEYSNITTRFEEFESKLEKTKDDLDLEKQKSEKMKIQVSDLDDTITSLSPEINKNKDQIIELMNFKTKQTQDHDDLKKASQDMLMVHRNEIDSAINGKVGELKELYKNMDIKLDSLESADAYLQETNRALTERTEKFDNEMKRIETASLALIKDQMRDVDDVKQEVSKVESKTLSFFDKFDDLQSQITNNKKVIDEDSIRISDNSTNIDDINEILKNLRQSFDVTVLEIGQNKQFIEKNQGDINIRIDKLSADFNQDLNDKLDSLASGENAKHQKISNTCSMLESDLDGLKRNLNDLKSELDGQNQLFKDQLNGLSVQHTETVKQMNEVTVLATNIDVHVKQQEEQKAIDTADYNTKIEEISSKTDDLMNRIKKFDELSRNQGERILLIEKLGDELERVQVDVKDDKEKVIALWEQFHMQREEQSNSLNAMLAKVDMERQESARRAKDELDLAAHANNQAMKDLTDKLVELENRLLDDAAKATQSHETRIATMVESHNTLIERLEKTEISHRETIQRMMSDQSGSLTDLQANLEHRLEQLLNVTSSQQKQIEDNTGKISALTSDFTSDLLSLKHDFDNLKIHESDERDLIVSRIETRIKEETTTLESYFKSLETRVDTFQSSHSSEISRIEKVEKFIVDRISEDEMLLQRLDSLEKSRAEQERLLAELEETTGERARGLETDLSRFREVQNDQLRTLRADVENDKQNLWTLLVEIYSAFRGSTLVLKSEGVVRDHQADVLGVYRMVDHYNDRPVYKQDGGENYIYYSATSSSWLVGTVVGHQYGWLRNGSDGAQTRRWIPDLETGWEYRPLTRSSEINNTWCTDDGTLRIESLREVEKVNELLRDIKNSREID